MQHSSLKKLFMLSKLLFTFLGVLCTIQTLWAQPANDACVNAQVVTIPASGTICINSTNTGATSDLFTNGCDTGAPGNEVWYTFVATGATNSVSITPSGGATSMVVSLMTGGCAAPTLLNCGAAVGDLHV